MFRNYLKIAWRNIVGNPLFSAINIVGLAIGLACCIIITLFVRYEMSYDKHWVNADRTYRVTRDFFGNNLRLAAVAPPIAPLLKNDFPEIEDVTRVMSTGGVTLTRGEKRIREENLVIADPNVFEFFGLQFVNGDAASALANPSNIVLTRRAAERYFGDEDPIGKTLNLMDQADVTVSAIIEDLPENTHMAFELLISIGVIPMIMGPDELESWGSNNYYTYLRLPEGYDPDDLESRFVDFMDKNWQEDSANSSVLNLQYLPDIHLTSNRDGEWQENGSLAAVYSPVAMTCIALTRLLCASLRTSQSGICEPVRMTGSQKSPSRKDSAEAV
jgi:putative ABC transport system permease protein